MTVVGRAPRPSLLAMPKIPVGQVVLFFATIYALLATAILGLGTHMAYHHASLTCTRGGDCVVARREGLLASEQRFPAADLLGAAVDRIRLGKKGPPGVQLALLTRQGPVRFSTTPAFREDQAHREAVAREIDAFAHAKAPATLAVRDRSPAFDAEMSGSATALLLMLGVGIGLFAAPVLVLVVVTNVLKGRAAA